MGSGPAFSSPSAPLRMPTSAAVPAAPSSGGLMVMVTSLAHALGCQALRPNIANRMTGARVLMGSIEPGPACGTAPRGRPRSPLVLRWVRAEHGAAVKRTIRTADGGNRRLSVIAIDARVLDQG